MAASGGDRVRDGVVVIGRADRQGGAAVRHLLERGATVRLWSDAPGSPAALELERLGAGLMSGSLDDTDLERALSGARALVVILDQPDAGPALRLRRGKAIADAAKAAGVEEFVYSSAVGPDHHLVSCDLGSEVEAYVRSLELPATVLRPVTVMEEIPWYWLSRLGNELVLAAPFPPVEHLPMICVDDVGALAAIAVTEPQAFGHRTVPIAGDVESTAGLARKLGEALGEPVQAVEVQVEGVFMLIPPGEPAADIPWLRRVHPGLRTVDSWLKDGGGLESIRQELGRVTA